MAVGFDIIESARSHLFDTGSWGPFCDITLTLKQARQSDNGVWVKIDDYSCRGAFRHFTCQIASNCDPLFAYKSGPSDVAKTGGAEPHIAEQSRSWRAASGGLEVMRGS